MVQYYGNIEVVHELYIAISEDKDKMQIEAVGGIISMGEMTAYFIFNVLVNSPYQLSLCLVTMMILVVAGVGTTGTIAD